MSDKFRKPNVNKEAENEMLSMFNVEKKPSTNLKEKGKLSPPNNKLYTGLSLFDIKLDELPMLLDPIFPKVGLASLVGTSDIGKSTILKQFALTIALGFDEFIGYKANPDTKKVLFISTEDDPTSTSISLKKQLKHLSKKNGYNKDNLKNIEFLFDIEMDKNSENSLDKILKKRYKKGIDLIVIDAFTDVFSGDINSSTKVREFLNVFSKISSKYNCLVLFLHHIGKRTNPYLASKNNTLGSQAYEAKMRVLIELKEKNKEPNKRTFTITKGNYISANIKRYSKALDFNEETLIFKDTGKVIDIFNNSQSIKVDKKKNEILKIIKPLLKEKKSVREITSHLNEKGYKIGKSTVGNYLKDII